MHPPRRSSEYPIELRRDMLSKHLLFRELPLAGLARLAQFTSVRSLAAHETLFQKGDPGDGLFGILRGRIAIGAVSAEGRMVILNVLEKGEIFGEIALIDDEARSATATAMDATDLLHIHRDHFLPFLRDNPDLCIRMMQLLCARMRWASGLVEDAAFLDLPARLAKRLVGLTKSHARATLDHSPIRLAITQRELAEMLGATREAVNKHLTHWRELGLIDLRRGRILLHDQAALAQFVSR